MDFYSESNRLNLLQTILVKLPKNSLEPIVQEQSRFVLRQFPRFMRKNFQAIKSLLAIFFKKFYLIFETQTMIESYTQKTNTSLSDNLPRQLVTLYVFHQLIPEYSRN
ncbi:hypothetical protein BpHYR1_001708 [Brachionus plicatilis]|uniref:Uncharacterized protein n=1 Tax=Brachionus plicatilis TaxID=10195 RepID=A0A3M7T0C1_BRAPC|nr:hypothetical protein BpHYR1_001708 [Brachionus plicatilis]